MFRSLSRTFMFGALCLLVSGASLSAHAQIYDETLLTGGSPSQYPGNGAVNLAANVTGFFNGGSSTTYVSGLYPIQFYKGPSPTLIQVAT